MHLFPWSGLRPVFGLRPRTINRDFFLCELCDAQIVRVYVCVLRAVHEGARRSYARCLPHAARAHEGARSACSDQIDVCWLLSSRSSRTSYTIAFADQALSQISG